MSTARSARECSGISGESGVEELSYKEGWYYWLRGTMYEHIQTAYRELQAAADAFNSTWPSLVVDGTVWQLPLLAEQRTPDVIRAEVFHGPPAIKVAQLAITEFQRDLGQAPGTVMRLPGVFILSDSVLQEARAVNSAKAGLQVAIETLRKELNMQPKMRPVLMRRALGPNFILNQLKRSIQVFDAAPRQISFTWAGHTSGKERVRVGGLRERLLLEAEQRALNNSVPIEDTPEWLDWKALANLDDDQVLDFPKPIAPHPRCMLWFTASSRYDAMVHANLPIFVLEGSSPPAVVGLKDFDRHSRTARRPDQKSRQIALPGGRFFLPTESPPAATSGESVPDIDSTYRENLHAIVSDRST